MKFNIYASQKLSISAEKKVKDYNTLDYVDDAIIILAWMSRCLPMSTLAALNILITENKNIMIAADHCLTELKQKELNNETVSLGK